MTAARDTDIAIDAVIVHVKPTTEIEHALDVAGYVLAATIADHTVYIRIRRHHPEGDDK